MSRTVSRPAARLRIESLEDRAVPSWGSVPPSTISGNLSVTPVTLNAAGDASGTAAVSNNEVDWYRVTLPAGTTTFSATTPNSSLDTVLGVYNSSGQRVTYNDDISSTNRDSRATASLAAGTYYVGVTNYTGTAGGSYTWGIDAPAATVPPTVPPPPPPPAAGDFAITVRTSGLSASQQAVFTQAAARWAQVITGDLPNATYNGVAVDDVLIDASGATIDGSGGVLGQAGPDRLRSGSLLPIHGVMQFDTADLAQLESSGQLFNVIVHEMGHVLGIGTIWQQKGLLSGAGGSNPTFTGARATAAYNALFGTSASGVPVENTGGTGTRDGHWRESVFGRELMTGYLNTGTNPLSRVTTASLGDLGYTVNDAAADPYTPGGSLVAGGGGGTTGGFGLRAGTDLGGGCGCPLCLGLQRTVATVEGATPAVAVMGAAADWATADDDRPDAVAVEAVAPRRTPAVVAADDARPDAVAVAPPAVRRATPAAVAADLLLGALVG